MAVMPRPKPWWKSKTVQFNLATIAIAIVDLIAKSGLVESRMPYFILAIGIGNIFLRSITNKAITFQRGS